jgi:beta-phosphoglucomutase-like phosphatase (HAD superfamily)
VPGERGAPRLDPEREQSTNPVRGSAGASSVSLASARQPDRLDGLAASWWVALEAADSALRAAASCLGARELGERSRRLARERGQTVHVLHELARDLHTDSLLLDFVATPAVTPRRLGLPDGVIACVFDLDGVLTTSATVHAAAWADTLDPFLLRQAERGRRLFIPFDRRHDYQDHLAGRPRREGVRIFLASRGIGLPEGSADDLPGDETVHGLANRKNQVLQQRLEREGVAAFAGSRCYLEAARIAAVHPAVVSASAHTATILDRAGLAHLIEQQIDGNTIEAEQLNPKPAPDTLIAACRRLSVQPGQSAAFETTPAGIAAARAAGFRRVIAVDRGDNTEALRAGAPDLLINDLAELFTLDRAASRDTTRGG